MARLKFPKDKPKHISIRISPGHADRDGNPYLIRGILFRKRRRKNDSVNTRPGKQNPMAPGSEVARRCRCVRNDGQKNRAQKRFWAVFNICHGGLFKALDIVHNAYAEAFRIAKSGTRNWRDLDRVTKSSTTIPKRSRL